MEEGTKALEESFWEAGELDWDVLLTLKSKCFGFGELGLDCKGVLCFYSLGVRTSPHLKFERTGFLRGNANVIIFQLFSSLAFSVKLSSRIVGLSDTKSPVHRVCGTVKQDHHLLVGAKIKVYRQRNQHAERLGTAKQ